MTLRVHLVRHGATPSTLDDRFSGHEDVELSEEGVRQARLLGQRLASQPIAAVYSSPLKRARDTAELISEPLGLSVQLVDQLRELSHGRWEGLTRQQVCDRWKEEYDAWNEDPFSFAPQGGETGLVLLARALPALLQLVDVHRSDREIVVVSHKATIRFLVSSLLGFDPRAARDRLDPSTAALTILDFDQPVGPRLALFNDTSHWSDPPAAVPPIRK